MEQKYKVEQIFTKNYARLCAMATAILHDSSLAQDAVQEGWIRLHKAKQLDTSSEEKLEHLILITVRHAAYNIMRKGNPEPIEDSILNSIPDTSPSPHEIVESREVSRKIKNMPNVPEMDVMWTVTENLLVDVNMSGKDVRSSAQAAQQQAESLIKQMQ